MQISETFLEVHEHFEEGYQPLVDYGAWRVALLRFEEELRPENLGEFQRHNETDEVFVLLGGKCILFIGDGDQEVTNIFAQELEPGKLYNVKQAVWHTHALSEDAHVLVVENKDTTLENSPRLPLTPTQRASVVDIANNIWGG